MELYLEVKVSGFISIWIIEVSVTHNINNDSVANSLFNDSSVAMELYLEVKVSGFISIWIIEVSVTHNINNDSVANSLFNDSHHA